MDFRTSSFRHWTTLFNWHKHPLFGRVLHGHRALVRLRSFSIISLFNTYETMLHRIVLSHLQVLFDIFHVRYIFLHVLSVGIFELVSDIVWHQRFDVWTSVILLYH